MQRIWGVSGVNGNQLMKNAPEYHYTQVQGSRDWIGQQLDDDMLSLTGAGKAITTACAAAPTMPGERLG
jgi:hypothetical protein